MSSSGGGVFVAVVDGAFVQPLTSDQAASAVSALTRRKTRRFIDEA
jgi:hypothetical protein